jgi:hypothetical protein
MGRLWTVRYCIVRLLSKFRLEEVSTVYCTPLPADNPPAGSSARDRGHAWFPTAAGYRSGRTP